MTDLYKENTINVYIAYYDKGNILLATSKKKKLLKDYIEQIRLLKPKDYYIEEEILDYSYYYTKYELYILNEFYNLILPQIDIDIINMEYGQLETELETTINKLKYFAFIINNIKDSKDNLACVLDNIKVLNNYKEDKKQYKKILKSHLLSHPVLTSNIDEYFQLVTIYKEYKKNIDRFQYSKFKDE